MPWLAALLSDGSAAALYNCNEHHTGQFVDEGTNPCPVSRGASLPQSREAAQAFDATLQ